MPSYDLEILVRTSKTGDGLPKAGEEVKSFTDKMKAAQNVAMNATKVLGAFAGGAAIAWKTIGQGAEIEGATIKFGRLADSIGTTSDVLIEELTEATRGTRSEMELMASAADLMGLGLAKNEDELVRLTRVSGALGMNMNQLVLTLTNQTTARFDTLGVSVDGFAEKVDNLEQSGLNANEAFTEAFLQQAEDQILRVGDAADTTTGSMQKLTADVTDMKNEFLEFIAMRAGPAIGGLADYIDVVEKAQKDMNEAVALGIITQEEANTIVALAARGHDQWQDRLREVRDEVYDLTDGIENAMTTQTAYYLGMGELAREEYKAATANAWFRVTLDDTMSSYHDAREAADEYTEQLSAQRDELILAREEQERLSSLTGDYFTQALDEGSNALVSFNRTFATTGGLTTDQKSNLDDLVTARDRANSSIRSLQGGTAGLGLSEDELNEKLQEQYDALGNINAAIAPLEGVTSEITAVNEQYAYNQGAVNSALYEAADAAGASGTELAMLGLATGQLSEEQAVAALKSAALQTKILELGDAIANGMDPQEAINRIQSFQANLEAQDFSVRVGIDTDPIQKDSDKVKDTIQPAIEDTTIIVGDLGLEFIDMSEKADESLDDLSDSANRTKTEAITPLRSEVDLLGASVRAVPRSIKITTTYVTEGSAPSGTSSPATSGSIPQFATGGVVPGAIGAPTLALVHGGEEVLTPEQRQQSRGINVENLNITIPGGNTSRQTAKRTASMIVEELGKLT